MNSKECKEFINALEAICKEKQISEEVIFEGMTQALSKAYAKETNLPNIRIDINKKTGEIKGYSYQKVVSEYTDGEEDEVGLITKSDYIYVFVNVSEAPAVLHPAASVPESVHLYGPAHSFHLPSVFSRPGR